MTETTYTITASGYGGEIVIGKISQEAYDFWTEKNDADDGESLSDYNDDWDSELDIPQEYRIFEPSEWQECDDVAHECGAEMSELNQLEVHDEAGNLIWSCSLSPSDLEEHGVTCEELSEVYITELPAGTCVFVGQSTEKGSLYGGSVKLSELFDPSKLKISYNDVDGWILLSSIEYSGADIENVDYCTTGKSMELNIYQVDDIG